MGPTATDPKKTAKESSAASNTGASGGKAAKARTGSSLTASPPYSPAPHRTTVQRVSEFPNSQTITQAVGFKVVRITDVPNPLPPNGQKFRRTASFADHTGAIRGWIFGEHNIVEGNYYRIRNYCHRDGRLVVHTRTSTVRIPPFDIPAVHLQRAEQIFDTPYYPFKSVREITTGGLKIRVSFKGRVTKVEAAKAVEGGRMVSEVVVSEDGESLHLSLWEHASSLAITVGQVLTGHDCLTVYSTYHKKVSMSVSYIDEIKIQDNGPRQVAATLDGVEHIGDYGTYKIGLTHDGADYEYEVTANILMHTFGVQEVDEESIMAALPIEVMATIDGNVLTSMVRPN